MATNTVCPACGARGLSPFYDVDGVPLRSSVVLDDAREARAFPTGRLLLAACGACGFVTNAAFDAALRVPDAATEDQQGWSPTFLAYARSQAAELVDRYGLRGRRVLEIGCGRGDFLALVCALGANEGVGVDPLFHGAGGLDAGGGSITAVAEPYGPAHARFRPDLVVCRHTLEHIAEPAAFLRLLRSTLGDRESTPVVFEVPDVVRVFDEAAFWDVYYEHCSYFTPGSLARTFRACGFDVVDVRREYDGQYLVIHARAAEPGPALECEEPAAEATRRGVRFAESVRARVTHWRDRVTRARKDGPVVVWGSGSKCVAFVTALGDPGAVEWIVDVNPRRHGRYMPGIPRPISAPDALRGTRPGLVVVMNPVYRDEIEAAVRALGIGGGVVAL